MKKKISLIDIAKSRYGSDKNQPEWVSRRRSICDSCPLNSKNKPKEELTTQEKAWIVANHGKDTCLSCKCMLSAKTKLPHAECPINKWGKIGTVAKTASLEIQNISTTPLTIKEENNILVLDYGTIPIGVKTDVQLLIKDLNDNITDISASSGCGCTVPKLEKRGKDITLQINYNTKRVGYFEKSVTMSYKKNNIDYEKIFKIKGKTE